MSLAAARALYYSPGTRAHNISRYETDLVNYLSHWIARGYLYVKSTRQSASSVTYIRI